MGTSTFSGPIKAGTIFDNNGTTLGVDVVNVGYVVMAQSASITESATSADTDIVIPANSQIVDIRCMVTTAWDGGTNTLDVGDGSDTDEFVDGLGVGAAGLSIAEGSAETETPASWVDVGASDVRISVDSVAGGNGVGVLTVSYLQNINLS